MKKLILICLLLTSDLVHAVADRVNYSGEVAITEDNIVLADSSGSFDIKKRPYMAFSAKFVLSSWGLMGTAVNSCSIIWDFVDFTGRPSDEWIYISGLPINNTSDDFVRHALSKHPDIKYFSVSSGIIQIGIRKSALKYEPKLYDLELLVPIEQIHDKAMLLETGVDSRTSDGVNVRCISGALGNAGQVGLDTPYALDDDRLLVTRAAMRDSYEGIYNKNGTLLGRYVPKEPALKLLDELVKEHKREEPYPVDSQKITIVNAEFDLHPVINFISKVIREAKNAAHAEKMKRAAEQRREQLAKQTSEKSSSVDDTPTDQAYYQATSNKLGGLLDQLKKELVASARESTVVGASTHHTDSQHYHQYFANRSISDDALELNFSRIEQTEQAFAQFANSYTSKAPRDMRALYANVPKFEGAVADLLNSLKTIPKGRFTMGCSNGDDDCYDYEKPRHRVNISSFKMMESEVTFAMWDACVNAGGCSHRPSDEGWGRGNRPVMNVSYDDITKQFIPWLNTTTGQTFRLPSEAEWEYAARAESTTKFSWGNTIGRNNAHCKVCGSRWDDSKTAPVKSFRANAFGLYDMHGNVKEWVADCVNQSYFGARKNGASWLSGKCSSRVLRGSSWTAPLVWQRISYRSGQSSSTRGVQYGFRLAQDIQ